MVGGGDQLYNDHVWEVPTLAEWLSLPDAQERVLMDPDLALIDEVRSGVGACFFMWFSP